MRPIIYTSDRTTPWKQIEGRTKRAAYTPEMEQVWHDLQQPVCLHDTPPSEHRIHIVGIACPCSKCSPQS